MATIGQFNKELGLLNFIKTFGKLVQFEKFCSINPFSAKVDHQISPTTSKGGAFYMIIAWQF